jgi:hypothetical protein
MVKDAESNAAADKEKRERIDLKNQAETLIYQAEKQLGELGDKVGAEDKAKVEASSAKLKEARGQGRLRHDEVGAGDPAAGPLCRWCRRVPAGRRRRSRRCGRWQWLPLAGSGSSDDVIDAEFTESK